MVPALEPGEQYAVALATAGMIEYTYAMAAYIDLEGLVVEWIEYNNLLWTDFPLESSVIFLRIHVSKAVILTNRPV